MTRKKKTETSSQQHCSETADLIQRLHPTLRAKFVPLPTLDDTLTYEQLTQIFGGDLTALKDVVRLIHKTT